MRKPIPPVPALTSADVLEYSTALLQEHLYFVAHSGARWQTCDVWRVLLAAASQASTIEAVCGDWQQGPDANTVRQVLRECLANDRLELMEQALNQALVARLPRWLRRQCLEVAFDLHDEPYYGRAEAEAEFVCRGEAQKGTTHFYRCATAYVLARGVRFTLALRFVRKGERVAEVAKALYQRVAASGLRLRRCYFDRGFLSVELLQYLQAQQVSAIVAVSLGIGRRGIKALCKGRRSYRTVHTFHNPQQGQVTVPLAVVRTRERRRQGKRRAMWMVFVTLRCRAEPRVVRAMYRRRFGIESGYRLIEQMRIRTTSPCSAWRFLFMGLAVLLLTCWNLLQWRHLHRKRRGRLILLEGSFRLHRFLRYLEHAIDQCFVLNSTLVTDT
jgi:Transposase DDE domain